MRGKEPFRSLLEEARAGERAVAHGPPARVAPVPLAERLDRLELPGGTPARGSVIPPFARLAAEPPRTSALEDLFDDAEGPGERTRPLPAGATIDAALQDSIAALEATVEIPAQRRLPARERPLTSDIGPIPSPAMPVARPRAAEQPKRPPAPLAQAEVPAPVVLKPVPLRDLPRPPPLPAAKPKERAERVATHAPPPTLSEVAPEPRVLQVLGEENTIPGLTPTTRSSSSGKVARTSDLYRLQLEFEDTPARPLPRVAFVPPPPLPPAAKRQAKASTAQPKSAEVLADLHELEAIDDLRAMAKALGLDGVGEVSIPSLEGLPVLDADELSPALPLLPELDELGVAHAPDDAQRPSAAAMRAALEREVLDDVDDATMPALPAGEATPRPALACGKAVTPVIVKIPSRPKVSLESRERARRYYLDAVDLLGKGERAAAVQHLLMAIEHDDAIPLYRDLLEHLEGHVAPAAPAGTPALTVLSPNGKRSSPRDHWRSARPR